MSDELAAPGQPLWCDTPTAGLQINSVAISDDGQRCIAGTSDERGSGQFGVVCYNGDGSLRWRAPFGPAQGYQGVFWVAVSGNGAVVAAGGEISQGGSTPGLLAIYDGASGAVLFSVAQAWRINQLCLSADGTTLLACYGNTLALYQRGANGYALTSSHDFSPFSCNSCALSADGTMAAVSCRNYDSGQGQVAGLSISAGQMNVASSVPFTTGAMRVAMLPNGQAWAAAFRDGSCALFTQTSASTPLWHYQPSEPGLDIAYGIDLTLTTDGRVLLACGANLNLPSPSPHLGLLYVVQSIDGSDGPAAKPLWQSYLQYAANPGVSLDTEAKFVTATDGSPGSASSESPGNFYLFDGASGAAVWTCPTATMNWPMVITPDGAAILGGSDTGSVYYWSQAS
ncbi:WD40 repeat domain-containing protein [Massilia sp. PAMC28688]|uniref:WD40 repeat domain-containing protein n=1 Tax=Massilia sp. PAMC28688 TaxID=2861283 RepID=UPI001C62E4CA|nr:WD40 repeat domain-containing protein [Massilia sp. PAMC28688]QYF92050.1 WD40 repeat domain-containing protein [Massilia sp. PAMC28688]